MKIGIITGGFDMLALFKSLSKYDVEYHIYRDWNGGYYADKDYDFVLEQIEKGIAYLRGKGIDKIILPPIFELTLKSKYDEILPVFSEYLSDYVLSDSLVGKIGFLKEFVDEGLIKPEFSKIVEQYIPNENQNNIKKFNKDFPIWEKRVSVWKNLTQRLGYRSWMINRLIRDDIRYFKDAAVDTLVPMNYMFFMQEKIIKKNLNLRKIIFHGMGVIDSILSKYVSESEKYSINIYTNGDISQLEEQKRWMGLITRGGKEKLNIEKII